MCIWQYLNQNNLWSISLVSIHFFIMKFLNWCSTWWLSSLSDLITLAISSYRFIPSLDQPPNLLLVLFMVNTDWCLTFFCIFVLLILFMFWHSVNHVSQHRSIVSLPNASSDTVQISENIWIHCFFLSNFCKLLHVSTYSRPDITYALNKLGVFQPALCRLAFESLWRIHGYLLKYRNVLLLCQCKPLGTMTIFTSLLSPQHSITVAHSLCGFSDNTSSTQHYLHQIDGCCELIGTVVIDWKTSKM